ncbi:MAG TPA: ADP-ribosylglycohydrolase family protein [Candidatus Solibacter sp.]|nr:ADP-ribosylglycohydrolase family protein [Candidatus Solibacter sp.]
MRDRIAGCILGGALGDAWGCPWEGKPGPIQFAVPDRLVLSDDTQLTLATCESIIECGRVDPAHLASAFARWYQTRHIRGLGSSTFKAMRDLAAGVHWAVAGARGEFAAGNGAAMRIAPLAFLLDPADPGQRVVICDVCRITHHNDEAYAGALAVMLAIRSALNDEPNLLIAVADGLPDSRVRDRLVELSRLKETPSDVAAKFGSSGYVVESVPLALYCAQAICVETLPNVLSAAIRAGGDTDTIASMAGQVAGTKVGRNAIPNELISAIEGSDELLEIVEGFAAFVG